MKRNLEANKLSHIIIYVDENLPKTPFLSFCTNALPKEAKIRFTYLSYDNQMPPDEKSFAGALAGTGDEDKNGMFVITDSAEVLSFAAKCKIASAALLTDENKNTDLSAALYCITEIEHMSLKRITRMWERSHGIPWTIAVTDRLIIREQTMEDLDDLYRIYADKEALLYMEDLYEDKDREAAYLQEYIDNQYRFFEYGIWALTLKCDGTFIGRAGFGLREGFDDPEIGYIIGKEYRGRGYAKEALCAIMEYGLEEFGFKDYIAFTKEENIASVRLLQSLGFSQKGPAVIKGGEHAMYALTKQQ